MVTVFLFHRDLRLVDHYGLEAAGALGDPVLPLFVFTPTQVSEENKLRSLNSIQFMCESLADLEVAVREDGGRMYFAYGDTVDVLRSIHRKCGFTALVETADYTPYARMRTAALTKLCEELGVSYHAAHDSYLIPPGDAVNRSGRTFQKFTPFYETVKGRRIEKPHGKPRLSWYRLTVRGGGRERATRKSPKYSGATDLETMMRRLVPHPNPELAVHGGRSVGLALLRDLPRKYGEIRDILALPTSMLSAHNHYGTVSIREVYIRGQELGERDFVRQLWWRDFYGHIMADFVGLYGIGPYEFEKTGPALTESKKKVWKDWCAGTTGVQLIDAAMHQLLRTGFMHNRMRMLVASWLTKDQDIHWRLGERFFAAHLVDYDAAQNMMNWASVASRLPFGAASFRRLDPERQAARFDRDGAYVKRWLPDAV
jgi:deoxyribodipyrimidine photo-lyase